MCWIQGAAHELGPGLLLPEAREDMLDSGPGAWEHSLAEVHDPEKSCIAAIHGKPALSRPSKLCISHKVCVTVAACHPDVLWLWVQGNDNMIIWHL